MTKPDITILIEGGVLQGVWWNNEQFKDLKYRLIDRDDIQEGCKHKSTYYLDGKWDK